MVLSGEKSSVLLSFFLFLRCYKTSKMRSRDCPNGAVVKTPCFQCKEHRFFSVPSGQGTKSPCALWHGPPIPTPAQKEETKMR